MNTSQLPVERRNTKRIPVILTVRERSKHGTVMCVATDISTKGMALLRATPKRPSGPLVLEFSLPGSQEIIRVRARYVRGKDHGNKLIGAVKFEEVPHRLIRWLKNGLKRRIT